MNRGGFLSAEDRSQLIALTRDGSAASRLTRRANALVLLDDGWNGSGGRIVLNDDTIRGWHGGLNNQVQHLSGRVLRWEPTTSI
jgi:hypothetical protein